MVCFTYVPALLCPTFSDINFGLFSLNEDLLCWSRSSFFILTFVEANPDTRTDLHIWICQQYVSSSSPRRVSPIGSIPWKITNCLLQSYTDWRPQSRTALWWSLKLWDALWVYTVGTLQLSRSPFIVGEVAKDLVVPELKVWWSQSSEVFGVGCSKLRPFSSTLILRAQDITSVLWPIGSIVAAHSLGSTVAYHPSGSTGVPRPTISALVWHYPGFTVDFWTCSCGPSTPSAPPGSSITLAPSSSTLVSRALSSALILRSPGSWLSVLVFVFMVCFTNFPVLLSPAFSDINFVFLAFSRAKKMWYSLWFRKMTITELFGEMHVHCWSLSVNKCIYSVGVKMWLFSKHWQNQKCP